MSLPNHRTLGPAPQRHGVLVGLILVAAVVAIYGQTLGAAFINFDDPGYVYENAHVRSGLSWAGWRWAWTTLQQSNWHPLTWLSLMLDAEVYGLNAGGFHLTNLLLHAANTLLLFIWLRRATGALWPAALTAFFFAAHPLHVESVAWVTERKDVLSTLFMLLTLLAYAQFTRVSRCRWCWYWLALGLYALGLTAKPMLVSLPPVLLLLDYWPLARWTPGKPWTNWLPLLLEKLPFAALMATSCTVTYLAQRTQAVVSLDLLPVSFRVASAALGVGTYLQATFCPVGLGIYYPYWYGVSVWRPIGWAAALLGLTAFAGWRWKAQPYLLVGWLWFLGTLVPVIGLVQVGGQAVADRYMYVPHIGLFIAVTWAGQAAWARWPQLRGVLGLAAGLAAAACLGLSIQQAALWRDGATLFAHTIEVAHPPTARLYHLYGDSLVGIPGREADAEQAYVRALQFHRDVDGQDTALSLSSLWVRQKRLTEVVRLLTPVSESADAKSGVLNNLAFAQIHTGDPAGGLAMYRRCVARYPDYALGHFGLADCLRANNEIPGACAEYEMGLAHDDTWRPALTFLAWTYAHLDDPAAHARALVLAKAAVELDRGREVGGLDALAAAEAANGQWPQAAAVAQSALALATRPGMPAAAADSCRERLGAYQQRRLP